MAIVHASVAATRTFKDRCPHCGKQQPSGGPTSPQQSRKCHFCGKPLKPK